MDGSDKSDKFRDLYKTETETEIPEWKSSFPKIGALCDIIQVVLFCVPPSQLKTLKQSLSV